MIDLNRLKHEAIELLIKMINIPSISGKEKKVSILIENYLSSYGFYVKKKFNNIWTINSNYKKTKNIKTILINSHNDTVYPGKNWDTNPFNAIKINDKIIGLGSNDSGASVVALISTFIYLSNLPEIQYKLILSITAEEEISGKHGISSIIGDLGLIDLGIVGEPTSMRLAIAEKGLLILDCIAKGITGHSAKNNGVNAIYIAIRDIDILKNFIFNKISKILGKTELNITQIQGGIQHNVIPDRCYFVVDIRTNELYTYEELIKIIKSKIFSKIVPRTHKIRNSFIDCMHPIVVKAKNIGIEIYGSPTLSDQSIMEFPTVKIGIGDSIRSHSPNEYVFISEIIKGINIYINLLKDFFF